MLLCDDEPSPVSSDEVFFICEKQTNVDRDDNQDDNCSDNENESDCDNAKHKKTTTNRLNRSRGAKKSFDGANDAELEEPKANGKDVKEAESQTAHTILVKIQLENCSQCPDKSISLFSHEPPGANKENPCRKKKTVAVQVNFNSIESMVESHCVKISKVRCCNKASLLQSVEKGNKCNAESSSEKTDKKSSDSTKIYLWSGGGGGGGKALKKKSPFKSKSVVEKPKPPPPLPPPTIREPVVQRSNSCVEKSSKSKKASAAGCSPLNKPNRSSLTIEPDRITINLSKYSPCASRLAASSKILSGSSQLSPDSPLHGALQRSPSPRRLDHARSVDRAAAKQSDKMTLQASLSLNIQQFQKSHPAPRSRSVGDSCVTSPTSEATTLSYSPTGTEILSLEEVGPQSSFSVEPAVANVPVLPVLPVLPSLSVLPVMPVLPPPPPPELKFHREYSVCTRNANLETKC